MKGEKMMRTLWGSAMLAAALSAAAAEPTKVVFFFDTEDFIQPRSSDAIRDMANVLASEGVKGHFAMVGYLGKKLVDWRRFDVIDALKAHHVGTQTLYHSLHPNITEYTDIEDFDAAYVRAMEDEARGIGMLQAATGKDRMWCSVLPGNGNTIVGLYLYADMGIPFFGGGTGMYEDETKCGDIWYCNQRHLNYAYGLHLESFLHEQPEKKIDAKLDELAKQQVVTFYMHPHMAVCSKHWDWVFRKGNLYPYGEWPYAEARDPAVTAVYYERIKAFLKKLKADPRFEITDCPALFSAQNPRKPITRDDVPTIRAALSKSLGPVRAPAEWSIADCFLASVELLRGKTLYRPGKTYGFLYAPKGVKEQVSIKAADLAAAAKKMDVTRFLPTSIDVGGVEIGPADFLFAALEAIETGKDDIVVTPRDQLGDIARYLPKMATVNFRDTWIYTPEYKDAWTSNRLRWQFWTFRYERPSRSPDGELELKAAALNRYRFNAGPDVPAVYYDAYRPIEDGSRAEVAIVFIHGWGGTVRSVVPVFAKALAERAGSTERTPYVITPMFPRHKTMASQNEPEDGRAVWGDSWSNESRRPDQMGLASDDWRGGGDANGTSFSSYDYIDLIFSRFADKSRYPNLKRVILAGFSAGGQFAGRYAAIGKGIVREGVKVDYIAMSPSTEFRFDKETPWLYGLKGRPRYASGLTDDDIMRNLCSRRVWRGCGSLDIKGRPYTSLDMTPPAVAQGTNRLERFRSFARYLDAYPEWKKQVSFHVFEGIAHKEALCYPDPVIMDFVFKGDDR